MNVLISLIIKKYKTIIFILLLLVVQAYFTLTLPEYTANIVNIGVANSDMNYVYDTGTKMITMTVLATITAVVVSFFSSRFSSEYAKNLRKMIFTKALKFSNHELNNISKSSLITRTLIDVTQIQMFVEALFTVIILSPIIGFGGIIKSYGLGTNLYWIILLIVTLIIIFLIPIFRKILPYLGKLQKIMDRINRNATEVLIGMPIIKTFVMQNCECWQKLFDFEDFSFFSF